MGDDKRTTLKLNFDSKVRLEFRGATITSDAGLLACRELDDALSLTDSADDFLKESRTGKNILHKLIPLLGHCCSFQGDSLSLFQELALPTQSLHYS